MEQETKEQPASPETRHDVAVITPSQGEMVETPPTQGTPCPTCAGGAVAMSYVYAIGRVEARFPNLAAEKEFAQATGRTDTAGKPINRPSMPFYPSARTATWCGNCVGC